LPEGIFLGLSVSKFSKTLYEVLSEDEITRVVNATDA